MKTTESAFVVYCSTELVTPWHVEARSARVAFAVAADRGTGAYSESITAFPGRFRNDGRRRTYPDVGTNLSA